jgi:hypothetical protein
MEIVWVLREEGETAGKEIARAKIGLTLRPNCIRTSLVHCSEWQIAVNMGGGVRSSFSPACTSPVILFTADDAV